MIKRRRTKRRGFVTKVAVLTGWQMVCLARLAGGIGTIMTAVAASANASVIKHTGGETGGDMADGTILAGGNVITYLACRIDSVMTGGAVIHDAGMIEHRI